MGCHKSYNISNSTPLKFDREKVALTILIGGDEGCGPYRLWPPPTHKGKKNEGKK
jgi:hypothetical protein